MQCLRDSHYPTDHLLTPLSADPRLHHDDGTPCSNNRTPGGKRKRGPNVKSIGAEITDRLTRADRLMRMAAQTQAEAFRLYAEVVTLEERRAGR